MAKLPRIAAVCLVAGAIFVSQMGSASADYEGPKGSAVANAAVVAKQDAAVDKNAATPAPEAKADATGTMAATTSTASCVGKNAIKSVVYKADGTVVPKLRGNVNQGQTVTAEFVVNTNCNNTKLGMAAYEAVSPKWVPAEAKDQVLVDSQAGTFSNENNKVHKLQVKAPACYYQVDFFTGVPVAQLDERGGYFNGNLIDADNDGTKKCDPPVVIEECPATDAGKLTEYTYTINGKPGFKTLKGNVKTGDTVKVDFTIAENCKDIELSLVSYEAPSATYSEDTADKQVLFDKATGKFNAGKHTLEVKIPACYFQVDFVRGSVITKLGPKGSNNFYGSRLIEAANGGQGCTVTTPPPVRETTTTSTTVVQTTTSTTAPVETEVLGSIIEKKPAEVAAAELAETGAPFTGTLVGLGSALTLLGAAFHGAAGRMRRQ